MPPVLIGSVVPMLWTFPLEACVSAVKYNAKRAADDFLLNAHIYYYRTKFSKYLSRFRAAEMPFSARSRSFFANSRSLSDNMGQLCRPMALGTLHIDRCSPRKPNNFIQTRQLLYKYQIIYISQKLHIIRCNLMLVITYIYVVQLGIGLKVGTWS